MSTHPSRIRLSAVLAAMLATLVASTSAMAQSEAASRQSEASLGASLEVPLAAVHAMSQGARLVVTSVQASGEVALVTLSAGAAGASFVVRLSADAVRRLGLAAGASITVTAVATGWILSAAGEALWYIANEATRPLIHSSRIAG